MSLLGSATLQAVSLPLRSTKISSDAYVLSLTELSPFYVTSASAPSNVIDFFDKFTLQVVQTLPGHEAATTYLRTAHNIAGLKRDYVVSSGKDGTVKVWDERSNTVGINMTNASKVHPLLCCDVSPDGLTVAAGTDLQGDDALILYWDPRNPAAPLRAHTSTHSDDITAVHFFSGGPHTGSPPRNILLSASSDGLISTSNADEEDEDESVLHVGNWGCSVAQAGWIHGYPEPRIWASSDMETFSTWSDELDLETSLDIRGPSVHNQERTWVTDYLISCHNNSSINHELCLFVGSNEGDVALISNYPGADAWTLHRLWTTGHIGVVRSVLWDQLNNLLITGGEDSKINAWPIRPPTFDSSMATSSEGNDENDVQMDVEDDGGTQTSRKRSWNPGRASGADTHQNSKRVKQA